MMAGSWLKIERFEHVGICGVQGKATGQTRANSQMMIFWREFWHLIEEFETWPNFVEAVSDARAAGDNFEGGDQQL
jgi:hypothetical protein